MNENHHKSRLPPALLVTCLFCVLPSLYVGSYLAVVQPQSRTFRVLQVVDGRLQESAATQVFANYRIGGTIAQWLFWPAHQLDLRIRKETWRS